MDKKIDYNSETARHIQFYMMMLVLVGSVCAEGTSVTLVVPV